MSEVTDKIQLERIPLYAVYKLVLILTTIVILIITPIWGGNYLYKKYKVWSRAMEGQAELAHAHYNRQIAVVEAQAKREAAIELANADIERAKGVAKANEIIGTSLKNNEQYLRYLWIESLNNPNGKVIYVPTEANLPILEANRLNVTK